MPRKSYLFFPAFLLAMFMLDGCSQREPFATAHTSQARHKATMKRYRVRGHTYRPTYVSVGDTMRGVSSWYGPNFHGKYTSNGEIYNMHRMTAAHKTWPMDTVVRVENLTNGRSVVVRINDRGPFVRGRIIDCSYAAGKKLGLDRTGIAKVKLTVLGFSGKVFRQKPAPKPAPKPTPQAHTPEPIPTPQPMPRVRLTNFGVQVGAFRRMEGARATQKRYAKQDNGRLRVLIRTSDVEGEPLHRVVVMGFGSEDEARDYIREHAIASRIILRP